MIDNHPTDPVLSVTMEPTIDREWMQSVLASLDSQGFRDDTCPANRDINAWMNPCNAFLRFKDNGMDAGFIALIAKGENVMEMHPCFIEGHRGAVAQRAGVLAMDWAFLSTTVVDVTTFALDANRPSRHAAISAGFRELHRRPWPNLVNGETVTMVYYGMSIHEWFSQSLHRPADFPECPEWIAPEMRYCFPFFARMAAWGQGYKASLFWNRNAVISNLQHAIWMGRRGGCEVYSIGRTFFELHQNGVVVIGEAPKP